MAHSEPSLFFTVRVLTQAYQRGQENPHLKMRALRLKEIWGLAQGQKRSCSGLWVRTTATAGLPAPGPGPGEGCGDRLYPGQVFLSPGNPGDVNRSDRAQRGAWHRVGALLTLAALCFHQALTPLAWPGTQHVSK